MLIVGILPILPIAPAWAHDIPESTRPTVAAVRATSLIAIDGVLDEAIWGTAAVQSDFRQREPFVGQPSSERTEFRVLYDDEALYFAVHLYDREPDKIVARIRQYDANTIWKDDLVSINIDPGHDHRTTYGFTVTPLGAMLDGKGSNNGEVFQREWDGAWDASARITEDGWVAEIRIPFTTLEYDPDQGRGMGLQIDRAIQRRNELDDWAPLVPPFESFHASEYGHLTGIEIPSKPWRRLRALPYVSSGFRETAPGPKDFVLNQGFDLKYPIARNATGQVTVKTDFSQVDIDEAQINLNRFELFFPEKRSFFLEGSRYFDFGVPEFAQLFFSRRIGFESGQEVPILAGVRSYGKIGGTEFGVFNLQTEDVSTIPDRNFSLLRIRQDILDRSETGFTVVHRQDTTGPVGSNTAAGVDATLRTSDNRLAITTFAAGTHSDPNVAGETDGNGGSAYVRTAWTPGLWEVRQSNFFVSDAFNPEVGYFQRSGIFQPALTVARKILLPDSGITRITMQQSGNVAFSDEVNDLLDWSSESSVTVQTTGGFKYIAGGYVYSEEVLAPFDLKTGVTIPAGQYRSPLLDLYMNTPFQNNVTAAFEYVYGGFWGGRIHKWIPVLYLKPIRGLYMKGSAVVSWIRIPDIGADYFATALNFSGSYAFTPSVSLESNTSWNQSADTLNIQGRFRWRFLPLSDFFAVYSEERNASSLDTTLRGLVFKIVLHTLI